VEIVGPDRLAAAGIQPEDFASEGDVDFSTVGLTEDDGNAMYEAFSECDIEIKRLFVEGMTAEQNLSEEDAECLGDAVSADLLRRIRVKTFVEGEQALDADEELAGELFGVFAECPGVVDDTGG
jgi:hypothetical protein